MRITVEFYGMLRQLAGSDQLQIDIDGTTVAEALDALCRQQPALAPQLPRTACAIGSHLVRRNDRLKENDTLALIPPVSGGMS